MVPCGLLNIRYPGIAAQRVFAIVRLPQVARSYDIMVDDATLRREYTNCENLRDYYPLRPEAPGKPKVD